MQVAPTKRVRGHIGRGAVISLLVHAQLIGPLVVAALIYGGREEAQKAEEVDVGFESVPEEQLPADLPPLEPPKPDDDALDRLKPEAKKDAKKPLDKKKQQKPEPDKKLAEQQKPKPEPEVVVPPLPPMPEQPPPPPPERHDHEKVVDLDNKKDIPPPPDAKYLAQKNNRADVETRATETNLEKNQTGEGAASSPSQRTDEQIGSDKEKIAKLDDEKSAAGKKAPSVTPHEHPELASPDDRREKSLLALRDPAPRTHEVTPETADPSLPHAADGELRYARPTTLGADSRANKANGKRVKLAITGSDYEYMFGADAEADRRLAKKLKSSHQGRFKERQARLQSALENFIPEVKPGNQTELNTRAAPFAAYVARMHRSIHALWGFGQIEDWDELSGSSPFNNANLLTTLEMVLNGDGTISKITIVHASGYLPYDAAAIDVAYTAGPFPDPPREIRSKNGKIYVHWRFYRDGRQCGTAGVDYFILDNPPAGGDGPSVGDFSPGSVPRVPPTPGEAGPRHLRRNLGDDAHRAKMRALDEEVARAENAGGESSGEAAPAPAPSLVAEAQAPAARAVAKKWFSALAAGDVTTMTSLAETPFRATGGSTVRARSDLGTMLTDLAGEVGRRGVGDVQLFTPAGLRAALGSLPPGLDDGSGLVFALAQPQGGDALIAALAKRGDAYRVVAFVRR